MKIKVCFFSGTVEIEINHRKETYPLDKEMWKLLSFCCDNCWQAEVLPATIFLHLS